MAIRFFLLVNKQGQTRVAQYYSEHVDVATRSTDEAEIIRKCLARNEKQCSFMEYRGFKLVFRRYASLYFIVGCDVAEVRPRADEVPPSACALSGELTREREREMKREEEGGRRDRNYGLSAFPFIRCPLSSNSVILCTQSGRDERELD